MSSRLRYTPSSDEDELIVVVVEEEDDVDNVSITLSDILRHLEKNNASTGLGSNVPTETPTESRTSGTVTTSKKSSESQQIVTSSDRNLAETQKRSRKRHRKTAKNLGSSFSKLVLKRKSRRKKTESEYTTETTTETEGSTSEVEEFLTESEFETISEIEVTTSKLKPETTDKATDTGVDEQDETDLDILSEIISDTQKVEKKLNDENRKSLKEPKNGLEKTTVKRRIFDKIKAKKERRKRKKFEYLIGDTGPDHLIQVNQTPFPYHPIEVYVLYDLIQRVRVKTKFRVIIPDDLTDHQIAQFLNVHLKVSKTLVLLEKHYTYRLMNPQIFRANGRAYADISDARTMMSVAPFPLVSTEGYQIIYVALRRINPESFNVLSCCRFLALAIETLVTRTGLLAGHVIILDVTHINSKMFGLDALRIYQNMLSYVQDGTPLNIKSIIILNIGMIAELDFVKFIDPLILSKTAKKTIYTRIGLTTLRRLFGPKRLPKDLGGTIGTLREYEDKLYGWMEDSIHWFYAHHKDRSGFNIDRSC